MRLLRSLWNAATVSLLAGLAGGLLLGWLLSRGGNGWLAPTPWIIYGVALIAFAVLLSLLWPGAPDARAAPDDAGAAERAGSSG